VREVTGERVAPALSKQKSVAVVYLHADIVLRPSRDRKFSLRQWGPLTSRPV